MPKRKTAMPAPRNGHVAAMKARSSGAHGKTRKAERRAARIAVKKEAPQASARVLP